MNRRDFWTMTSAALAAGSAPCLARATPTGRPPKPQTHTAYGADLALTNATVWTMDPAHPRASAVLVLNGRIVHVGSDADILAAGRGVPHFDAGGRTVVPGFIDSHTHLETACQFYSGLHLDVHVPPVRNLPQMFDLVRRRVAETAEGRWILARSSFSFDTGLEDRRFPTRSELDALSTTHPIVILAGLHVAVLNTLAFKQLGLWTAQEVSQLRWKDGRRRIGTDVARDQEGVPTGVVTEIYDLVSAKISTHEETRNAIRTQAIPNFVAKGITSVLTMPFSSDDLVADQELQSEGSLPLRLRVHHIVPLVAPLESLLDCGLLAGQGNDLYRFGGVKLFVAGAGVDAHARPLSDVKWTQEELNDTVSRAHCAGFQVLLHEEGHESFELAVNAVEYAQRRRPRALRHRLEHYAELESIEEMRRVKQAGMRVTITVPFDKGVRYPDYNPRYATLIREGLEPVAISDATGTIPNFSPLQGIASIVASAGEGGSAPEGESPSLEDAIRMWTSWAASAQFEENDKGSITAGKLGDFAVLSGDLDRYRGGALFDLEVDATILGGKVVNQR
jgi:predicted amidohydrolase YtcJ